MKDYELRNDIIKRMLPILYREIKEPEAQVYFRIKKMNEADQVLSMIDSLITLAEVVVKKVYEFDTKEVQAPSVNKEQKNDS